MRTKLLRGCNIAAALFKTGFRSGHHVLEVDADRTTGFNGNATVNQCTLNNAEHGHFIIGINVSHVAKPAHFSCIWPQTSGNGDALFIERIPEFSIIKTRGIYEI